MILESTRVGDEPGEQAGGDVGRARPPRRLEQLRDQDGGRRRARDAHGSVAELLPRGMVVDHDAPERALGDGHGVGEAPERGRVDRDEQVGVELVARRPDHAIGSREEPVDARDLGVIGEQERDLLLGKSGLEREAQAEAGAQGVAIRIGVSGDGDRLGSLDAIDDAPPHIGSRRASEAASGATHTAPRPMRARHRRRRYRPGWDSPLRPWERPGSPARSRGRG